MSMTKRAFAEHNVLRPSHVRLFLHGNRCAEGPVFPTREQVIVWVCRKKSDCAGEISMNSSGKEYMVWSFMLLPDLNNKESYCAYGNVTHDIYQANIYQNFLCWSRFIEPRPLKHQEFPLGVRLVRNVVLTFPLL